MIDSKASRIHTCKYKVHALLLFFWNATRQYTNTQIFNKQLWLLRQKIILAPSGILTWQMTDNIFIHLLYSYMHLSFPRKRVYCLLYFVNSFFYPFHGSVCFSFVSLHYPICICTPVCVMFIRFEYLLYCSLIFFRNSIIALNSFTLTL